MPSTYRSDRLADVSDYLDDLERVAAAGRRFSDIDRDTRYALIRSENNTEPED